MKRRIGTPEAQVEMLANAFAGTLEPPASVNLRAEDLPIWRMLMGARARAEWSSVDLHHAANLARSLADIERMSTELSAEGDVLLNPRGTVVANPKHGLLEILSRRVVALTKLLQMHAYAVTGDADNKAPGRKAEAAARDIAATHDDGFNADELLATPARRMQ